MSRNGIDGIIILMNGPVDIDLLKGQRRAGDLRRFASGEAPPDDVQRENAIVRSADDILSVDFSPKGTPEQWARIIRELELELESYRAVLAQHDRAGKPFIIVGGQGNPI